MAPNWGAWPGSAVLDIMEEPGFLERVEAVGRHIEDGLSPRSRGATRGMFMGLRFDDPSGGMAATQRLIAAGVFAIFANNDPSVLQFLPPLTISDDEVEWLMPPPFEPR